MTAQTAPRIDWVDFAKGVAIILVVLGHAISSKMNFLSQSGIFELLATLGYNFSG